MVGVEDYDFVGEGYCFYLIVGDIDYGVVQLFMQMGDFDMYLDVQGGIEVGKWFIQQENVWFCYQCMINCYVLVLIVGEGFWFMFQQMGQLQYFCNLSYLLVNQIFFCVGQFQVK